MRNLQKNKRISRRVLAECLGANLAYSVAVFLLIAIAIAFCNQVIWYWENPLYRLLTFVERYMPFFVIPILLCGWLPITYHFISRLLSELEEVADAAARLTAPTEEPIVLSDRLGFIETELNSARERALRGAHTARKAEQRKNDLVVYLAHDLKTPLTSVIGYLTLLRDEGQIAPELREKYLSIALDKAEHLEDLINEFFEITRFNLSSITLDYQRVNMTRLLEQLTFEFQPMLQEKHLCCTLDFPPDVFVPCDPSKMQRVFDNLLRNAANYSFENALIEIRGRVSGNILSITFQNQGHTIPPEKLARLFEQFYRLDAARSSKSGGAGLGLAIAKEIVAHHCGTLTAKSADNTVTFEVTLPLSGL